MLYLFKDQIQKRNGCSLAPFIVRSCSHPSSRARKSSFGVLSQVGNVQAWLALIPTYSKHPKLSALAHTLF